MLVTGTTSPGGPLLTPPGEPGPGAVPAARVAALRASLPEPGGAVPSTPARHRLAGHGSTALAHRSMVVAREPLVGSNRVVVRRIEASPTGAIDVLGAGATAGSAATMYPTAPPQTTTTSTTSTTTTLGPVSGSTASSSLSGPSAPLSTSSPSTASGQDDTAAGPADPGYTFMYPDGAGGSAAWWDPCATVRYAVNLSDAPAGAMSDATEAMTEVAAATGLHFTYAGTTAFSPNPNGLAGQMPGGIDVVVGWVTPGQLGGPPGEAGVGGNWWEPGQNGNRIHEGFALINGDIARSVLKPGFGAGYTDGRLLLHELGHMVGLAHSDDPQNVMYPQQSPLSPSAYGPGDLAGLRELGSGACG